MDASEIYIKQCDCEEIQGQRKPKVEKMPDGRWHKEWELEAGDFIGVYSTYNLLEIEIKGTTIYDPYFYNKKEDADINISTVGFDEGDGYTAKKIVWLPRQDQIQAMFNEKPFVLSKRFDEEMENYITGNPDNWSFEMLWLAFYMWKRHKKIWDGEKWVNK